MGPMHSPGWQGPAAAGDTGSLHRGLIQPGQESCVLRYRPSALAHLMGLVDTGLHPPLGALYPSPAGINHSSGK